MNKIDFGTVKVYIRPLVLYLSYYLGIGKVKASCLSSFLLNHPYQKDFKRDFQSIMYSTIGFNILYHLFLDAKIRLYHSQNMKKNMVIFCYKAIRLFQNLPTKGQRTKANAGTPRRLNPYLKLKINLSIYPILDIAYHRKELFHNGRYEELKAFNNKLLLQEKTRKEDRKLQDKKTRQSVIEI
jgi:ribosomal protein S13